MNPIPVPVATQSAIHAIGQAALAAALDVADYDADILAGQLAAIVGRAAEACRVSPLDLIAVVDDALAELIAGAGPCPLPWIYARRLLADVARHFRTH